MQWFRARANLARTNEEVNLVIAESKALRRGFAYASKEWLRRAEASEPYCSAGATSYAHEQSDMFRDMSERCDTHLTAAWEKHHTLTALDDRRQDVYGCTQKMKKKMALFPSAW